jgi:hypothetical protein
VVGGEPVVANGRHLLLPDAATELDQAIRALVA